MEKQFTATVFIIKDNKTLLIKHKKLNKWLPPGGHVHQNELPPDAAIREALEETGLHIKLISDENIWINRWNAESFLRPYLCLCETIPEHGSQKAHFHMDMIYLGEPLSGKEVLNTEETEGLEWFSLEEILALSGDQDIFIETQEICKKILK